MVSAHNSRIKKAQGTPAFTAPETATGEPFSPWPLDIWALGTTLFYFVTGRPPFMANNLYDMYRKIQEEDPDIPEHLDPGLQDVIRRCLDKNPETRITIGQLISHPWVDQKGSDPVLNPCGVLHATEENLQRAYDPHHKAYDLHKASTTTTTTAKGAHADVATLRTPRTPDKTSELEGEAAVVVTTTTTEEATGGDISSTQVANAEQEDLIGGVGGDHSNDDDQQHHEQPAGQAAAAAGHAGDEDGLQQVVEEPVEEPFDEVITSGRKYTVLSRASQEYNTGEVEDISREEHVL